MGSRVLVAVPVGVDAVDLPRVEAVGLQLRERNRRGQLISAQDAVNGALIEIVAAGFQKTTQSRLRRGVDGRHENHATGFRTPEQALGAAQDFHPGQAAAH